MDKHKFQSSRICNMDKTGIPTVQMPLGPTSLKEGRSATSLEMGKTWPCPYHVCLETTYNTHSYFLEKGWVTSCKWKVLKEQYTAV